jgi:tetratricopeptide (TPR) repeat protein
MELLRKPLISLIILVFGISVPSLLLSQENLPEIVKRVKPSTVVILTYDKDEKALKQGSGFFISREGDVITNRHVLEGAIRADIKTTGGKVYPVKQVVAEDTEGDIVRVSVDTPPGIASPLKISGSLPSEGERILVIGSPLGLEQTISDGIVSAIREIPGHGKVVQITAPISSGSSGSPVVNTKGEVVGIATFLVREGQNLNFAIPQERLAKLSAGNGDGLAEWTAKILAAREVSVKKILVDGINFMISRDYEKALACCEEALKIDPSRSGTYCAIGECHFHLTHYQEAIEAYKQAIRFKPDSAEAYFGLGDSNSLLSRFQEAIEACQEAIRIKPDYAEAYIQLGYCYCQLELVREAVAAYKQAIRIKPDHAYAHYFLSLAYMQRGDKRSAMDEYEILKELDADLANELLNVINRRAIGSVSNPFPLGDLPPINVPPLK